MSWLDDIENLKPGDPCEFRFLARSYWKPAKVVSNGGSGYWTVEVTEAFTDEESGSHHPTGDRVSGLYIEHIRPPGCKEAWNA